MEILKKLAVRLVEEGFSATIEYPGYLSVSTTDGGYLAFGFENNRLQCTVWDGIGHAIDGCEAKHPYASFEQLVAYARDVCQKYKAPQRASVVRIVAYVDGKIVGEETCSVPAHLAEHVAQCALVQAEDPDLDLAWENWANSAEREEEKNAEKVSE